MTNLDITRGDDETIELVITDPDGDLQDLTGCDLWFYVKASPRDADLDAVIAKGPADVTIDPDQVANTGQATVAIDAADTASLADHFLDKRLNFEVQLEDSADAIQTVASGYLTIRRDLVRTTT